MTEQGARKRFSLLHKVNKQKFLFIFSQPMNWEERFKKVVVVSQNQQQHTMLR